jgi:hypothetical protein
MRYCWRILGALLTLLMTSLTACAGPVQESTSQPGTGASAQFEVVSLDVTPGEVVIGEEATVTAKLANITKNQQTYPVKLFINGTENEKRDVTIGAEATEIITFKVVEDNAGTYTIKVGELNRSLVVKKQVLKEIELKYDDGEARDWLAIKDPNSYLIDFIPPITPFTISELRINGRCAPKPVKDNFEIEIWDKDRNVLYNTKVPVSIFVPEDPQWVEIGIPNIEVKGQFYVKIHTGTDVRQGIHISVDDSVVNEHSNIVTQDNQIIEASGWKSGFPAGSWFGDKSKVNWMVRVVGTAVTIE